jgi:hypothetical protein
LEAVLKGAARLRVATAGSPKIFSSSRAGLSPTSGDPKLETQAQSQLSHTWIYCCAADDAEGRRGKVSVGVRELGVVERVKQFSAKFNAAFLTGANQAASLLKMRYPDSLGRDRLRCLVGVI